MLRLWNRLLLFDPNRLTAHIFVNDYYMAQGNIKNWCYNIWQIMCSIGCEDLFYSRSKCDIKLCELSFLALQEESWKEAMRLKPKLMFYRMFKENFGVEQYVQLNLSPSERSCTAQLRAGILPLHMSPS